METGNLDQSAEYWKSRDIKEEIRTDWLLLRPGQFYGLTTVLKFTPLKPGRYWIVATHVSGYITDKEKPIIGDLDYPLLLGNHSSPPLAIDVKASNK